MKKVKTAPDPFKCLLTDPLRIAVEGPFDDLFNGSDFYVALAS